MKCGEGGLEDGVEELKCGKGGLEGGVEGLEG